MSHKAVESLMENRIFPQFLTFDVRFVRNGSNLKKNNRIFPHSFWRSTSVSCERVEFEKNNRNFSQFLTFDVHFVRKGCNPHLKIGVLLSFWRSTSISCEKMTPQNRNFTSVFDVRRPFRAKGFKFAKKIEIFPQFFDVHFVQTGCEWPAQLRQHWLAFSACWPMP